MFVNLGQILSPLGSTDGWLSNWSVLWIRIIISLFHINLFLSSVYRQLFFLERLSCRLNLLSVFSLPFTLPLGLTSWYYDSFFTFLSLVIFVSVLLHQSFPFFLFLLMCLIFFHWSLSWDLDLFVILFLQKVRKSSHLIDQELILNLSFISIFRSLF